MIEAWEAKAAGDTTDAQERFEAAKRLAAARGLRYLVAEDVAALPMAGIVNRVVAARDDQELTVMIASAPRHNG